MEPLREWWSVDKRKTQQYFQSVLHRTGAAADDCTSELAAQIILNHLSASSMLTIIPLQDWLAISDELKRKKKESERINIPENPNHIWDYRMHISLEQLLQANDLNQKIRDLIESSGR
jgi:4-alpha-glucanotransferase